MARVKAEMKCPYCDEVKAVSGMTSHVRARHTEHYEEFKKNRLALVEKYKIVEGQPAPVVEEPITPSTPNEELMTNTVDGKGGETPALAAEEKKPEPAPKEQPSGSFLGSVGKALREW